MTVIDQGYELVPLEQLIPYPGNPRRGDLSVLKESFTTNGVYGALVVQRSTRYVLAGNHRLQAAAALGLESLPVIWADVDDDTARRILLVDNRSNDLAGYDSEKLAGLLSSLEDLTGTGYVTDDLTNLIHEPDLDGFKDPDERDDETPAGAGSDAAPDELACPKCGSVFPA